MLSRTCYHVRDNMYMLSRTCYHVHVITYVLSRTCYHVRAITYMLSRTCYHVQKIWGITAQCQIMITETLDFTKLKLDLWFDTKNYLLRFAPNLTEPLPTVFRFDIKQQQIEIWRKTKSWEGHSRTSCIRCTIWSMRAPRWTLSAFTSDRLTFVFFQISLVLSGCWRLTWPLWVVRPQQVEDDQ